MNNKDYQEIANKHSKSSPCFTNCLKAFFFGGTICMLGEAIAQLCLRLGAAESDALLYASLTLIFIAGLLTGIGIFDKIAKHAGAGTLVPITGFSNAMASAAIEAKTEGFVTGVGASMFSIAGPVIVYGTVASVIYGFIYWLFGVI